MNNGQNNENFNYSGGQYGNYNQYGQDNYGYAQNVKGVLNRSDVETYVKWGKILGIVYIVMGALSCLSCFGIVIGIPYILSGIKIKNSAESLERILYFGDEMSISEAFHNLTEGLKLLAIVMIVSIVISIVASILLIPVAMQLSTMNM